MTSRYSIEDFGDRGADRGVKNVPSEVFVAESRLDLVFRVADSLRGAVETGLRRDAYGLLLYVFEET